MQNPVEQGILAFQIEGELVVYARVATLVKACTLGSADYAYHQAMGGLWGPEEDRFARTVLLAEMLD